MKSERDIEANILTQYTYVHLDRMSSMATNFFQVEKKDKETIKTGTNGARIWVNVINLRILTEI